MNQSQQEVTMSLKILSVRKRKDEWEGDGMFSADPSTLHAWSSPPNLLSVPPALSLSMVDYLPVLLPHSLVGSLPATHTLSGGPSISPPHSQFGTLSASPTHSLSCGPSISPTHSQSGTLPVSPTLKWHLLYSALGGSSSACSLPGRTQRL